MSDEWRRRRHMVDDSLAAHPPPTAMTRPAACSRPHDHRHADGIIPSHQPALGVQEKHHACLGEGSDEDSAKPEWFECGCPDSDSLGEPEGHAAVIKVVADEEPVLTD